MLSLVKVELGAECYNLDLTMMPSFLAALYRRKGRGHWVKVAGFLAGRFELKQRGDVIEVRGVGVSKEELEKEALLETGLWHPPFEHGVSTLPAEVREAAEKLASKFPGVRLAISPRDFHWIFTAVVLSKRSRWEVFTRKWLRGLWELTQGVEKRLLKLSSEDLKAVGTSYQLFELRKTLRSFAELGEKNILDQPSAKVRRLLMKCYGVGPKMADSTLLFTKGDPSLLPVDTHLIKVSRRYNLVEEGSKLPIKDLCLRYACDNREAELLRLPVCPLSLEQSCVREKLRRRLGNLSGWFQTLAYLEGSKIKPGNF